MADERNALAAAWTATEGLVSRVGSRGPDRELTEIGRSDARVGGGPARRTVPLSAANAGQGRQMQGWH